MPRWQFKYLIIITLFNFVFFADLSGQVSYGGNPLPYDKKKAGIDIRKMPLFDYNWVLKEISFEKAYDGKKPLPVGWNYTVDFNPGNSGYWEYIPDSLKVWRLEIYSENAYAISVFFNKFLLNKGVRLFLYDPEQNEIKGSYDHRSNKPSGNFPVSSIEGERIIIELQIPDSLSDFGQLNIGSVTHFYVDLYKSGTKKDSRFRTSESCNVDINCPAGDNWQEVKRSVCRIIFSSGSNSILCSGALINNTSGDGIPYLLTANHCIEKTSEANSAIFYFGYESPECNGSDGPSNKTIAGSEIKATSDSLDFSLLLLSEDIPETYNPYFAGWTTSSTPAPSSVCIHHPNGDVKKISTNNNPLTSQYQNVNPPGWLFSSTPGGFWRVIEWDQGATQGGSSGAPLLNNLGLIVGNLTGGDASCLNPKNDYFSKFHLCWDYYSLPAKQLKPWLDKDETGRTTVPGYDPYYVPDTASTLMDLITNRPELQTLSAAILSSGLSQSLEKNGQYTIFAPTNEAFNSLFPGAMDLIQSDPEGKLASLIKNHIVENIYESSSLYNGLILNTLSNIDITININNSRIFYDFACLSEFDIKASNGILHLIDQVILPLNHKEDPFVIFPNPAINEFWIITHMESMRGARLKLFNLYGSLLAEYVIQNDKLEKINLTGFPSGIYLIEIFNEQKIFNKKLMLSRPDKK